MESKNVQSSKKRRTPKSEIQTENTKNQKSKVQVAGGGVNSPEDEVATLANLPAITRSIATVPNGRIYFANNKDYWYLDPTDSRLKRRYSVSGFGTGPNTGNHATYDFSICEARDLSITFDKSTSAITKLIAQSVEDAVMMIHPR